jgi:hypothetical protein
MTRRIAMWSGPRNLSTAMMYAFAQRADCAVLDEPFYGVYLARTARVHPMRAEILASMPQDADAVVRGLTEAAPAAIQYQKHMCQHMIPGVPRGWMGQVANVFLIRHPARVIASFAREVHDLTAADIGFALQAELYDHCRALGQRPVVVDSADIRRDPEGMLRALCAALEIAFDPAMLCWPTGGNPADGVWAPVWYRSLHRSTGFAGEEGPLPVLEGPLAALEAAAFPPYQRLKAAALTP